MASAAPRGSGRLMQPPWRGFVFTRQADFRYASRVCICGTLLAFTGYLGYPRALILLFAQGFE